MLRRHCMANLFRRMRACRKATQLSQRELAFLVGLRSQSSVSEVESGDTQPGLLTVLACIALFDLSPQELLPGVVAGIEEALLAKARALHAEIEADPRRSVTVAYLAALIARLDGIPPKT